jgi:flagellar basal body-associated protein FliL
MPEAQGIDAAPSFTKGVITSGSDHASAAPNSGDSIRTQSHERYKAVYVIVIVVLVAASIAAYFLLRQVASAGSSHSETEATLNLDTFILNLEGGNQRAYLRVGITLGLSQPLPRKLDAPVAPLRDAIVSVLSSAQPEQLLTSEGKQKIKSDLLKALQERAPELGIENVYFTEFLVQM